MSLEQDEDGTPWKIVLGAFVAAIAIGAGSLVFLGEQVSGILSTVGASVPPPGEYGQGGAGGGSGDGGGDAAPGGAGNGDGSGDGSATGGSTGNGSTGGAGSGGPGLIDAARPELLIVKTGELTVQVEAVDQALNAAIETVDRLGGYVSASSRSGTGEEAAASVTFRIPVTEWDRTLVALRSLGGTILDEQTGSEDVTAQVVDIEARIRNLQVTEAAFQSIMTKATAIKDVLTVQNELTTVRGEIERLQSQAAHIREQAGMSTLTMRFRRTPEPAVAAQEAQFDPGAEADAATASLVGTIQAAAKVGIWFGIAWLPVLLALALVGGVAFAVYRRLRAAIPGGA